MNKIWNYIINFNNKYKILKFISFFITIVFIIEFPKSCDDYLQWRDSKKSVLITYTFEDSVYPTLQLTNNKTGEIHYTISVDTAQQINVLIQNNSNKPINDYKVLLNYIL